MTPPVAGAPAVARDVIGLVAWNVGGGFSLWHLERPDSHTVCGIPLPLSAAARFSRRSIDEPRGVLSDQLCQSCIAEVL